jgi:hypothetical protein
MNKYNKLLSENPRLLYIKGVQIPTKNDGIVSYNMTTVKERPTYSGYYASCFYV